MHQQYKPIYFIISIYRFMNYVYIHEKKDILIAFPVHRLLIILSFDALQQRVPNFYSFHAPFTRINSNKQI
jgi:hypothetical protein